MVLKTKLFLAALAVMPVSGSVFSGEKPRIGTIDFKETGNKVAGLGHLAANRINDLLVQLGTVEVVDRVNLDQTIQVSEIVEEPPSALGNKISGMKYLVTGEVSNGIVTRSIKKKTKKYEDKNGNEREIDVLYWKWTGRSVIHVRIVDIATGIVIYSGSKAAKSSREEDYLAVPKESQSTAIIKAIIGVETQVQTLDPNKEGPDLVVDAVTRGINNFKIDLYNQFRPSGYIISIEPVGSKRKKMEVTIDLGNEFGVKKNERFEVIEIGKPFIHPVTKEEMPGMETVIYKLKMKEIRPRTSMAIERKKKLDKAGVELGMVVKARKKKSRFFRTK